MPKIHIPQQDPKERVKNFDEVSLGYTEGQAVAEAKRCLSCKKPMCVGGCPVEIDIPAFIKEIANRDFAKALEALKSKNNLPAVCGRVCPQETQCEQVCIVRKTKDKTGVCPSGFDEPVAIGRLERFVADWGITNKSQIQNSKSQINLKSQIQNSKQKKVAVIGAGPAGLTCAADLARMGWGVTIFESLSAAGGVLQYGIPAFRLPRHILDVEVGYIRSLGVEIALNSVIGATKTIDDLRGEGFSAFFIATGAGLPYFMGIEGENLNGVYSANEFLTRVNLMKAYRFPEFDTPVVVGRRVAVIGAGNVAMDSARSARRLGADEVVVVYRRSRDEMPAREEEIKHAEEEGIKFKLLTNPTKILGTDSGWVKAMECIKNELGNPDDSGRRRPVPIKGSEYVEPFETVISAIGQGPNPLLLSSAKDLKLNKRGYIDTDTNTFKTSMKGVYAGGDIVTGAATVISAMGAGKRASRSINEYLSS